MVNLDQTSDINKIELAVGHYRFHFKALEDIFLRRFSGSSWRGIFGNALKKTVCITNQKNCRDCMLFDNCAYPYIFESFPPKLTDRMRRYKTVPSPYLIKIAKQNQEITKEQTFELDLVLFGRGNNYLPYIIQAFIRAGKLGITGKHAQFECLSVAMNRNDHLTEIWNAKDNTLQNQPIQTISAHEKPNRHYSVELETPLRLLHEGKIVQANNFQFHHLFRLLLRRISMLIYFHQAVDIDLNYRDLVEEASTLNIQNAKLRWFDWDRYSSRQNKAIKMGGIVGSFTIDLTAHPMVAEMLWLGQHTHVGKATTMGNGQYSITELASLPHQ